MCRPFLLATVLVAAIPLCPEATLAQSSLGLNFADLGLVIDGNDRDALVGGFATGDFRVTGAHGIQLDLGFADRPEGVLGQVDGHLYLAPGDMAKYGFVLSLADVDGREMTVGSAGVEGLFQVGEATFVSGQAILGYARPGSIDFIGLSGGLLHALNDRTALFATLDVAEFDEEVLRTTAYSGRLGISWQPSGSAWEITAALGADGLTGHDSASADGWAEIGLTWRFGAGGGAARPVAERAFRRWQPFDPLLRRGLF